MELVIEATDITSTQTQDWLKTTLENADIWYDATGVGWDISYVARFEALRATLHGVFICAWDTQYEEARISWTGQKNSWPAALAQCMRKSDLRNCTAFAEQHGLSIFSRSEVLGMDKNAPLNGALVLDLSWV